MGTRGTLNHAWADRRAKGGSGLQLVGPDNQIFQIKSPLPQWKIEQTPVESPAEQAAMSADKQKCSNFVNSLPIGEMAKKITVLTGKLADAIDNCVVDKEVRFWTRFRVLIKLACNQ